MLVDAGQEVFQTIRILGDLQHAVANLLGIARTAWIGARHDEVILPIDRLDAEGAALLARSACRGGRPGGAVG